MTSMNLYSSHKTVNFVLESGIVMAYKQLVFKWYNIFCNKEWPQERGTVDSQEQSKVSRSRVVQAPPPKPLPSHPSPRLWLSSLATGMTSQAGNPVDEHCHPPVRLFDRAARPIITPHARLPLFHAPRCVIPR